MSLGLGARKVYMLIVCPKLVDLVPEIPQDWVISALILSMDQPTDRFTL